MLTCYKILNYRQCVLVMFLVTPTVLIFYVYLYSNVSTRITGTLLQINSYNEYTGKKIREIYDETARYVETNEHFNKSKSDLLISPFGFENHTYLLKSSNMLDDSFVNFKRCADIFNISQAEINKAERLINNMVIQSYSPDDYINMTKNCYDFTINRKYIMQNFTKEEANFPIAYSILMYKNIEQFERLLRAIYRPQNFYCVHVDLKANVNLFKAVESIAGCFSNLYMAPIRVAVKWGKFSVLEPELICMKFLYEKSKFWKYFINLTGQEFPLKTNFELVKILSVYNGSNDIMAFSRSTANMRRWRMTQNPPHNITAFKGSVHIAASRSFVEYAIYNRIANDFLDWVIDTRIPDETFFPTLNHNPHLKISGSYTGILGRTLKDTLVRYKVWRGNGRQCSGMFVRGVCIFGIGDLQVLAKSPALFANKFHWSSSSRVAFDCIEELIFNRTWDNYDTEKTHLDIQFYATRNFVKQHFP